jgi:hypothetical protein
LFGQLGNGRRGRPGDRLGRRTGEFFGKAGDVNAAFARGAQVLDRQLELGIMIAVEACRPGSLSRSSF